MYCIIWEFDVKEGYRVEFEKVYGSNGEWSQLFKLGDGYLGTYLLRDENNPRRYVTIDRWVSSTAYEKFKQKWGKEYQELDARCEGLTESEKSIGVFIT